MNVVHGISICCNHNLLHSVPVYNTIAMSWDKCSQLLNYEMFF